MTFMVNGYVQNETEIEKILFKKLLLHERDGAYLSSLQTLTNICSR